MNNSAQIIDEAFTLSLKAQSEKKIFKFSPLCLQGRFFCEGSEKINL